MRSFSVSKLSYTVMHCLRVVWTWSLVSGSEFGFRFGVWVQVRSLCSGSEFGFRFGVPEAGVGMDGASASGSLRRLCFRVWYLATGGGHVVGCDSKARDWMRGTMVIRGLAQWSFTAVRFYTVRFYN